MWRETTHWLVFVSLSLIWIGVLFVERFLNVFHYCMSSVGLLLIVLINNISQALMISPCDLPHLVELQSAIYRYPFLIRVQPIFLSDSIEKARQSTRTGQVMVREVIKTPLPNSSPVSINDMILIRFNREMNRLFDDSCWQLLRSSNADLILFLNDTRTNGEFHLPYPPVESTVRVRENIDAVLSQGRFHWLADFIRTNTFVVWPLALWWDWSMNCENAVWFPLARARVHLVCVSDLIRVTVHFERGLSWFSRGVFSASDCQNSLGESCFIAWILSPVQRTW